MTDERDETKAKPFLKWAGGKRGMLPVLRQYFPERFGTYFEPFLGGGAVFFALAPSSAVISDSNQRLVRTYEAVRDHADHVVDFLARSPNDEAFFRKVRQFKATATDTASVGASTIYLNRTCFNGLWRVNGKGEFNVPFGRYKNPSICDEPNLRACSAALKRATLLAADFETVLDRAVPGDFVYCDPPYLPISATASFTAYTPGGFGLSDHRRLRDTARRLKERGVHVLISNSAAPEIVELYREGFEIIRVQAPRSIAGRGSSRGSIEELIIR